MAGVLVAGALFIAPILFSVLSGGFQSARQKQALQSRSDYSQIATAAIALARAITNDSDIMLADPRVSPLLRSLSPQSIWASSNCVEIVFHGGFDHYGYRVRRSKTNGTLWTLLWYTEKGERVLGTISP